RIEAALLSRRTRLLSLDLGAKLSDLGAHLALSLVDERLAPAFCVGNALVRLFSRHGEISLDGGDLGGGPVLCLLNSSIGLRGSLRRRLLHIQLGSQNTTDARQVVHLVGHVLDLQGIEHETHAAHVVLGFFEQRMSEAHLVLVDFLRRQAGEHASQVAFQRFFGHMVDLLPAPPQKAFDGVGEQGFFARQLDVGYPLERQGNHAFREGAGHVHHHGEHAEVHLVDPLDDGPSERSPTTHETVANHAIADPTRRSAEDQRLVGGANLQQLLHHQQDDEDDESADDGEYYDDASGFHHDRPPFAWVCIRPVMSTPIARPVSLRTSATAAGKLATAPVKLLPSPPSTTESSPISARVTRATAASTNSLKCCRMYRSRPSLPASFHSSATILSAS